MNGPPQKPTTACSGVELGPHEPHGLEHGRERLLRIGHAQPGDVGRRPDRLLDDRPDALDELDLDAHAEHRGHDVREHHGGVHAVAPDGLEGHLGAELRRVRHLEELRDARGSARYSGSERPAWRMNHTGVRSTGSRRAARTRSGAVTDGA